MKENKIICHQKSVASHLASKDNTSHHIRLYGSVQGYGTYCVTLISGIYLFVSACLVFLLVSAIYFPTLMLQVGAQKTLCSSAEPNVAVTRHLNAPPPSTQLTLRLSTLSRHRHSCDRPHLTNMYCGLLSSQSESPKPLLVLVTP